MFKPISITIVLMLTTSGASGITFSSEEGIRFDQKLGRHQKRHTHAIKLRLGYELKFDESDERVGPEEEIGFDNLKLFKDGKMIFLDSEIGLGKPQAPYPMVFRFGKDHDEILLLVSESRYSFSTLRLVIRNDSVVTQDFLPSFQTRPSSLAGDKIPFLAGLQYDYDVAFDDSTYYDPILYYKLSPNGIALDSALTISRNEKIYGRFYGWRYSEDYQFLDSVEGKRLLREQNRIQHMPAMKLNGF